MHLLAVRVRGLVVEASVEQLCNDPCRVRLYPLYPEWRPSRGWGVSRYTSLMAIEPLLGAAGATPLICPSSTHCYKLEYVSMYAPFWDRGAETLASHVVLCSPLSIETRSGPWVESLKGYLGDRIAVLEVDAEKVEARGGYCADVLHNPFFHEGGATLVYELYEQLGTVDAIVAPGYPALLESIRVGYERLSDLGLVEEPPRVYAVDVGVGVPRWLASSIELYEVKRPRDAEKGAVSLRTLGLKATRLSSLLEAARIELLEMGELGKDEVVVTLLL